MELRDSKRQEHVFTAGRGIRQSFVGGDNGVVYSLDAKTGCLYWAYQADMFGRFAPIAAPISGHSGTRYAIMFVTRSTTAYALDAQDGKLLWKIRSDPGPISERDGGVL